MGIEGIGRALGGAVEELAKAVDNAAHTLGNAVTSAAQPQSDAARALADSVAKSASGLEEQVRDQFGQFHSQMLDAYRASGFAATLEAMRESAERLAVELDKSLTWTREQAAEQARWAYDAALNPALAHVMRAADWTYEHVLDPVAAELSGATAAPRDRLAEELVNPPLDAAAQATGWLGQATSDAVAWLFDGRVDREAETAAADAEWYERVRKEVSL